MVVLFCIAGVAMAFLVMELNKALTGADPFEHDDEYSVGGIITVGGTGYAADGIAKCHTLHESDNDRIYRFDFSLDSAVGKRSFSVTYYTDSDGTPVDLFIYMYTLDGLDYWSSVEKGMECVFAVGEKCRIMSISVESDEYDLLAQIKL